ncbi:unnamed protein product, partial [Mesorhabditis belari]|uniref:P-type domain-containing protein n=1 Tax=Mesorhabditis belari TaxID=2138241 RepID=A0AAF3FF74_9BILA
MDQKRLGILIFLCLFSSTKCFVDVNRRVDCFPDLGASQAACTQRGCSWDAAPNGSPTGTPYCYYPTNTGYAVSSNDGKENIQLTKQGGPANPYGADISPLTFKTSKVGNVLEISIGTTGRYTPPLNLPKQPPSNQAETLNFQVTSNNTFSFKVTRQSTGRALWDTSIGGLLFADKYIQIATLLPSDRIFGFGEHVHKKMKHDMTRYTTWPMFARDIGPDSGSALSTQNLYGTQPFYLCVEPDGKAHGVLIINSNAQEVTLGPAPHLIYRTIGGQLDLAFFPGPKPEDVIQGFLAYIGRPFLPAYWALGYQLCRWGYKNLADMQAVITRNQAAGIPLDVPYADIDYMSHYEDFTEGDDWSGFPAYAQQLHSQGLHLILIFDPAIEVDYSSFQRGIDQNASFIEWPRFDLVPRQIQDQYPMAKSTKIMLGNVWPERNTAFPDFLDTTGKTDAWWAGEFARFHNITPFDGMWIDMNEPSNFDTNVYSSNRVHGEAPTGDKLACPISGEDGKLDNPPYQTQAVYMHPGENLCSKTLCMNAKTQRGTQDFYNTKNLYGWSEARSTYAALKSATGKRGAVISRSTFISSGRYSGHWLGDNTARWEDLQTSVIGAMEFNMFGIPYVGSDICGFNGPTTEELCLRWHQMGAFHSFSRNHNTQAKLSIINSLYIKFKGDPAQDPAVWPSVAQAAKQALTFRYQYLPYLYSLHYRASLTGSTVVRPLFFEFPIDSEIFSIDRQFLWGSALMIAPALDPGVTTVRAYFPADRWYSLQDETYGNQMPVGYNTVNAATTSLTPVFVRGGSILPRQTPTTTTTSSRQNPFEMLIAVAANAQPSFGELFYDDGVTLFDDITKNPHFSFNFNYSTGDTAAKLTFVTNDKMDLTLPTLDIIEIFGYEYYPDFNSFIWNGKSINVNVQTSTYYPLRKMLYIKTKGLIDLNDVASRATSVLTWSHRVV